MKNKKSIFIVAVLFLVTAMTAEAYAVGIYSRGGRMYNGSIDVTIDKTSYLPGEQIRLRSIVIDKPTNQFGTGSVTTMVSAKVNGVSNTIFTNYSVLGNSYDLRYVAENTPGTYFAEIVPVTGISTLPNPAKFFYTVASKDNGCAAKTCVGASCFNGTTNVAGTKDCGGGCSTTSGGIFSGSSCMPKNEIVPVGTVMGNSWAPAGYNQQGWRDFTCRGGYWEITYDDGGYYNGPAFCSWVKSVDAVCGASNNVPSLSAPTSGFCEKGTYLGMTGTGPWNWSCEGLNGGKMASCSAPLKAGNCGTSNGQYFLSTPTTGLCSTGSASKVTGTGPWSWTCNGAPCSAYKKYDCNNVCSAVYSYTQATFQSSNATCTVPISASTYSPNCSCGIKTSDPFGYTSACLPPSDGVCGTDNGKSFTSPAVPTALCSAGTLSSFTTNTTGNWTWSCLGSNGGENAMDCYATLNVPADGACGEDNGKSLATAPTRLCTIGEPSAIDGDGPWNWSCNGIYGGASKECFSSKANPVNIGDWREVNN